MHSNMTIRQRLMRCRLIEEAEKNPDFSEELGLVNMSEFDGSFKNLNDSLNDVFNNESIKDMTADICTDFGF